MPVQTLAVSEPLPGHWCPTGDNMVSLRGPPCAHGVAGTPYGEVRDKKGATFYATFSLISFSKSKKIMGLKIHHGCFKTIDFLEWHNVVASMRYMLMLICWSNWKKDLRFLETMFSNCDENLCVMGLYKNISTQNVPHFHHIIRVKVAWSCICKSIVWSVVGNNDLALWWSQWLL